MAIYSGPCTLTHDPALIDWGGRVGIGTPTPTATLSVAGDVGVSGRGNGVIFPDSSKLTTADISPFPRVT
ncbi:MAG: hypothetical protein ACLQOO_11405 [Terriglobia bacterium]